MSNFKAKDSLAKFLLHSVGGPTTYKQTKLSVENQRTVDDTMRIWLALVWETCVDGDEARFGRWLLLVKELPKVDLFDFLSCLDLAADWLATSAEHYVRRDWRAFKEYAKAQLDSITMPSSLLLGLLKSRMQRWRQSDTQAFAEMREVLCYPLRINLKDRVDLAQAAYEKWLQSEDNIDVRIPNNGIEQMLIRDWFPDTIEVRKFFMENFLPHHGTGSTLEGAKSTAEKYQVNGLDENLYHLLRWCGDSDPFGLNLMQSPVYRVEGVRLPKWSVFDGWNMRFTARIPKSKHRIIGVPKNWKTYRLVSKEPTAYMFYELGLNTAIQRYLKDKNLAPRQLTRGYCVDTEDRNRSMARLGSVDGEFVTIDLSAASDSVALTFVRWCFNGSVLEPFIRTLRTEYAEFDLETPDFWGQERIRDLLHVSKFAPMGSGICFSIECIVFAAIVVASILTTPGADRRWAVYGDDIVVHISVADTVIQRLTDAGFTVNVSKSFVNAPGSSPDFFRESCGGEYLNGTDVTPHRVPRKFSGLPTADSAEEEPTSIAQAIQLANDLFDRPAARAVIIRSLLDEHIPVFFDEDGTQGIRSGSPTNFHLKESFNKKFQRWEVDALVLRTYPKNPLWSVNRHGYTAEADWMGEVVLFDYLCAAERSSRQSLIFPEDQVNVRMDPFSTEVKAKRCKVAMPIPPFSHCVRLRNGS